jgi:hypothetical protein
VPNKKKIPKEKISVPKPVPAAAVAPVEKKIEAPKP